MEFTDSENNVYAHVPVYLNLNANTEDLYDIINGKEEQINLIDVSEELHLGFFDETSTITQIRDALFDRLNVLIPLLAKERMQLILFVDDGENGYKIILDGIHNGDTEISGFPLSDESRFEVDYYGDIREIKFPLFQPAVVAAPIIPEPPVQTPPRIVDKSAPPALNRRKNRKTIEEEEEVRTIPAFPNLESLDENVARHAREIMPRISASSIAAPATPSSTLVSAPTSVSAPAFAIEPYLNVTDVNGNVKKITGLIFSSTTIGTIKTKAKQAFGLASNVEVSLIHYGKLLTDDWDTSLTQYGLKSGDTLKMTVKLRSGRMGGGKKLTKHKKNKIKKNKTKNKAKKNKTNKKKK